MDISEKDLEDWLKFIERIAKMKVLNDTYHETFIQVFGRFKDWDEKVKTSGITKAEEYHLTNIYKLFEKECQELQIKTKNKRESLRIYLRTLYFSQRESNDCSSFPSNPEHSPATDYLQPSIHQTRHKVISRSWTVYEENIWVGRRQKSQALIQKILSDCRIAIILGITGIGKTALAERIAHETQHEWDQIVRINFDDYKVRENFLEAAKFLLKKFEITVTPKDYKKTDALLDLLLYNIQSRQSLLIIDSLEFILSYNQEREQIFQDELWHKFFKRLLTMDSCQGRVILTSQVFPDVIEQVASRYPNYFYKSPVMSGLTDLEQLELFARAGLDITENSESRQYLTQMGKVYEGHPLSLITIIGEIQELCAGNVLAYWDQYGEEFERVERDLIDIDDHTGIDDQWRLHSLSSPMEDKVKFRLQQTLKRLKKSCYSAYCLLCEASVFRGSRPERQWINQFQDRGDLPEELSKDGIDLALRKLYDWYLIESERQQNKRYIRLHNLVRSIALEHLNQLQ